MAGEVYSGEVWLGVIECSVGCGMECTVIV